MNVQHIVFHSVRSSVNVVSHCRHVVVCSHSFEIAFHAQSCHTSKQILSRGWLCPISVSLLVTLVSDSSTMRKDCRVHRGMVMSGPLVFRLPVLSRASCSWLERNATNSSTDVTWSSNVCDRSSSLAFLSSRNTFSYWAISVPSNFLLLCYRYRLWTPSRWPVVSSPHTFVRVFVPPSIFSSFKLNSGCSLLEDKNTVSSSVTAIPMRSGIFQFQLSSHLTKMNTWTIPVSN